MRASTETLGEKSNKKTTETGIAILITSEEQGKWESSAVQTPASVNM